MSKNKAAYCILSDLDGKTIKEAIEYLRDYDEDSVISLDTEFVYGFGGDNSEVTVLSVTRK